MESELILIPREKSPLPEKNSLQRRIEPTTLHQAGQRAQHTTNQPNPLPTSPTHYQPDQPTTNQSNPLPTSPTHYQTVQPTTNQPNTLPTSPTHYQPDQHTTNQPDPLPTSPTHYQPAQHTTNQTNPLPTSSTHYQPAQHTTNQPNTLPTRPTHYQPAQHTTNQPNTLPTSPTHYQPAQLTTNELFLSTTALEASACYYLKRTLSVRRGVSDMRSSFLTASLVCVSADKLTKPQTTSFSPAQNIPRDVSQYGCMVLIWSLSCGARQKTCTGRLVLWHQPE